MALQEDTQTGGKAKQIFLSILSCALFGVMAVLLWRQFGPAPDAGMLHPIWFYDLEANKLVPAADQLPPVTSHGSTLVRAYVFTCSDCADSAKRYVGYIERFDPDLKLELAKAHVTRYRGPGSVSEMSDEQRMRWPTNSLQIRLPKASEWVDYFSPEGSQIREGAVRLCPDGSQPQVCVDAESPK